MVTWSAGVGEDGQHMPIKMSGHWRDQEEEEGKDGETKEGTNERRQTRALVAHGGGLFGEYSFHLHDSPRLRLARQD